MVVNNEIGISPLFILYLSRETLEEPPCLNKVKIVLIGEKS